MNFNGHYMSRDLAPEKRKRDYMKFMDDHSILVDSFDEKFDDFLYKNMDLEIKVKEAALKASKSVVSIVSFNGGGEPFFHASGTILACEKLGGTFLSTILTSASLVGTFAEHKIKVRLFNGQSFEGQVGLSNFHYNILIIKIKSELALPVAIQRPLDDSVSLNLEEDNVHTNAKTIISPHSTYFKICPGELVIALGRFKDDCEFMVAPGQLSLDVCGMDCVELLRADCNISKCGIGGPLINCHGEVIGLNFYNSAFTPFLPINVVSKFLEKFTNSGKSCRPFYGMEMTNLYAASVDKLEKLIAKYSINVKGVLIENVMPRSPAALARLREGDFIIQCNEKPVRSLLEFFVILMDKIGESVELLVIRSGVAISSKFFVVNSSDENCYSWPVPSSGWRIVGEGRCPR